MRSQPVLTLLESKSSDMTKSHRFGFRGLGSEPPFQHERDPTKFG